LAPKSFGVEVRLLVNFCFSASKNVRTHGVQATDNINSPVAEGKTKLFTVQANKNDHLRGFGLVVRTKLAGLFCLLVFLLNVFLGRQIQCVGGKKRSFLK
jgi:hypothetical protein